MWMPPFRYTEQRTSIQQTAKMRAPLLARRTVAATSFMSGGCLRTTPVLWHSATRAQAESAYTSKRRTMAVAKRAAWCSKAAYAAMGKRHQLAVTSRRQI
jgi:sensor c-di-GMP phosphodiesterase-like protein